MPALPAIRRARLDEAELITALTLRSKAHWGYDSTFMRTAAEDLKFRPEKFLPDFHVYVLEQDSQLIGYCALIPPVDSADAIELHDLFVEPRFIGQGHEKQLWDYAIQMARSLGFARLILTADPNAEAFYVRQGATRVGAKPSTIDPARTLPVLELRLCP